MNPNPNQSGYNYGYYNPSGYTQSYPNYSQSTSSTSSTPSTPYYQSSPAVSGYASQIYSTQSSLSSSHSSVSSPLPTLTTSTHPQTLIQWYPINEEKNAIDLLFTSLISSSSTPNSQTISGMTAVQFLKKSNLNKEILRTLWTLVDPYNTGVLTLYQFYNSIKFVSLLIYGNDPSSSLSSISTPSIEFYNNNLHNPQVPLASFILNEFYSFNISYYPSTPQTSLSIPQVYPSTTQTSYTNTQSTYPLNTQTSLTPTYSYTNTQSNPTHSQTYSVNSSTYPPTSSTVSTSSSPYPIVTSSTTSVPGVSFSTQSSLTSPYSITSSSPNYLPHSSSQYSSSQLNTVDGIQVEEEEEEFTEFTEATSPAPILNQNTISTSFSSLKVENHYSNTDNLINFSQVKLEISSTSVSSTSNIRTEQEMEDEDDFEFTDFTSAPHNNEGSSREEIREEIKETHIKMTTKKSLTELSMQSFQDFASSLTKVERFQQYEKKTEEKQPLPTRIVSYSSTTIEKDNNVVNVVKGDLSVFDELVENDLMQNNIVSTGLNLLGEEGEKVEEKVEVIVEEKTEVKLELEDDDDEEWNDFESHSPIDFSSTSPGTIAISSSTTTTTAAVSSSASSSSTDLFTFESSQSNFAETSPSLLDLDQPLSSTSSSSSSTFINFDDIKDNKIEENPFEDEFDTDFGEFSSAHDVPMEENPLRINILKPEEVEKAEVKLEEKIEEKIEEEEEDFDEFGDFSSNTFSENLNTTISSTISPTTTFPLSLSNNVENDNKIVDLLDLSSNFVSATTSSPSLLDSFVGMNFTSLEISPSNTTSSQKEEEKEEKNKEEDFFEDDDDDFGDFNSFEESQNHSSSVLADSKFSTQFSSSPSSDSQFSPQFPSSSEPAPVNDFFTPNFDSALQDENSNISSMPNKHEEVDSFSSSNLSSSDSITENNKLSLNKPNLKIDENLSENNQKNLSSPQISPRTASTITSSPNLSALSPLSLPDLELLSLLLAENYYYEESYHCAKQASLLRKLNHSLEQKHHALLHHSLMNSLQEDEKYHQPFENEVEFEDEEYEIVNGKNLNSNNKSDQDALRKFNHRISSLSSQMLPTEFEHYWKYIALSLDKELEKKNKEKKNEYREESKEKEENDKLLKLFVSRNSSYTPSIDYSSQFTLPSTISLGNLFRILYEKLPQKASKFLQKFPCPPSSDPLESRMKFMILAKRSLLIQLKIFLNLSNKDIYNIVMNYDNSFEDYSKIMNMKLNFSNSFSTSPTKITSPYITVWNSILKVLYKNLKQGMSKFLKFQSLSSKDIQQIKNNSSKFKDYAKSLSICADLSLSLLSCLYDSLEIDKNEESTPPNELDLENSDNNLTLLNYYSIEKLSQSLLSLLHIEWGVTSEVYIYLY